MPGFFMGPSWRVVSPSGGSTLTTSAPRSPSCWAAHGPSTTVVQSTTRTPRSGPDTAGARPGAARDDDRLAPDQDAFPGAEEGDRAPPLPRPPPPAEPGHPVHRRG